MDISYYDLCIIGGGINGAGIARDAAGRGFSVVLLEAGDLASGTSSASTKLIHGGLRYLEYGQFRMVREALRERDTLLSMAPHIIRPMDFILPHDPSRRTKWLIRLGLWLYGHLHKSPNFSMPREIDFQSSASGDILQDKYESGFVYQDGWTDDSRLVVLNALGAVEKGAKVKPYTRCESITPRHDGWEISTLDTLNGDTRLIRAASIINAAGPDVTKLLSDCGLTSPDVPDVRRVKGSHIIVKRLFDGPFSYILQNDDRRVVFAIPYENDYTLIGTTEVDFEEGGEARISDGEIDYLCAAVNNSFKTSIGKSDVEWAFSGVRPLITDKKKSATATSREYHLHHHHQFNMPLISLFGGKLTTYRTLAEKAVDLLCDLMQRQATPWTATEPLPGGDIAEGNMTAFTDHARSRFPWLPDDLLQRYAGAYGTRMFRFLEDARSIDDLGLDFGCGLYEAEVLYLMRFEFARTDEDILWRRTKIGMKMPQESYASVMRYIQDGRRARRLA